MLAFIDESGVPHPNDVSTRPNEYQRAVRSWYRYIERLTFDLPDGDGETRYGLYRMRVGAR